MNITNKFSKIGILITNNGLVTILKQMPMPAVAKVIVNRITG